jgi:hypothetical protein
MPPEGSDLVFDHRHNAERRTLCAYFYAPDCMLLTAAAIINSVSSFEPERAGYALSIGGGVLQPGGLEIALSWRRDAGVVSSGSGLGNVLDVAAATRSAAAAAVSANGGARAPDRGLAGSR